MDYILYFISKCLKIGHTRSIIWHELKQYEKLVIIVCWELHYPASWPSQIAAFREIVR